MRRLFGLSDRNISTTTEWIAMDAFCADIHVPQMMNPNDFAHPLTFPLAPS